MVSSDTADDSPLLNGGMVSCGAAEDSPSLSFGGSRLCAGVGSGDGAITVGVALRGCADE